MSLQAAFLHFQSLIAKPGESLAAFLATPPPMISEPPHPIIQTISTLCKIHPAPIRIQENPHDLFFWEGACCLIDQDGATILTRPHTQPYILAHECIHGFRYRLNSPCFEEFFAYEISAYVCTIPRWRTLLGPLFQSSYEVIFTMISFWMPVLALITQMPLLWGALLWPCFLVGRLVYRRSLWKSAVDIIRYIWNEHTLAVLLRLDDSDLLFLAHLSPENARAAILDRADWRLKSLLIFEQI